ncbi:MAG TPA: DUF6443 domain-containing protein [Puia sp.]|nr:DUF6443 domain-containing protein [Puia sp.]
MILNKWIKCLGLFLASGIGNYGLAQVAPIPPAYADTLKVGYVREWTATAPEQSPTNLITRPVTDVKQTTRYFDGLGRPLQTVAKQISPLGKDLVTAVIYDSLSREHYKYLPFVSNPVQVNNVANDGNFKLDAFQEQTAFAQTQYPGENYYYNQTNFELSPLSRVVANYPAGNSWIGAGHGESSQYLINESIDSVHLWNIAYPQGSIPTDGGIYPAGQLYKNMSVDEQNHAVVEYKDKEGHVLLKKVQLADSPGSAHVGWLCTYYIYDDLNNLRFVLQPRAVELVNNSTVWTISQSIADELCFRYEYDGRHRMIIKKTPGAGEVWMVYDSRDRLVLSQDANLRGSYQWLFTKYDSQNRIIIEGFYTDATHTSQSAMQSYLTTQNMAFYETQNPGSNPPYTLANSFPVITDATKVTGYNYYDDYSYAYNLYGYNYEYFNTADNGHFMTASTVYPYPQPLTQSTQTRGLPTGSYHQFLSYASTSGIISTPFYDDHNRVIQTATNNIGKGIDVLTTQYDFSGHPLRTFLRTLFGSPVPQHHYVLTKMNYDAVGRLKNIWKNIDSAASDQLIDSMRYNELGELSSKYLGNNLDNLVYEYNIRGWVTGINKAFVGGTANHYFGMELGYDDSASVTGTTSYLTPQFNGNIAGTIWKSAGDGINRKYDFTYDNVNRLTGAAFLQNPGGNTWNIAGMDFTVDSLAYDANGNILKMNQNGFKVGSPSSPIDLLTYSYYGNSNKLLGVGDAANDSLSKLGDFHYKGNKKDTAYTYDGNGNLVVDKNKGMTISYNYLNLPYRVNMAGKGTILYSYNTAGERLQKQTVDSLSRHATMIRYAAGLTYQQTDTITNMGGGIDTVQYMGLEEGRARWAFHKYTTGTTGYGWEYDFMERDHLGNTRVLLTQQKDTATYAATMEGAYRATENALFYNIPASVVARPSGYPVDTTVTNPNDSVVKVTGSSPGQKVGPAIILKVMSGDNVTVKSSYYYSSSSTPNGQSLSYTDVINSLATGIVGLTGGAHGSLADLIGPSTPLTGALTSFITTKNTTATGKPNAYLNYVLLDNQFKYDSASSGALQVGASGTYNGGLQIPLTTGISITKSGYLYIYVSNATPLWDVFFDNLIVTTRSGPMLEENHYYPGGLTMSGISDKALKTQYAQNKYRYNGKELQNQEFSDGTGLEEYDFGARMQDPQLSVWHNLDPLADVNRRWSPFVYAMDNPVRFIDPDGMDATSFVNDIWNKSGSGNTTWTNNNNGTFSSNNGQTASTGAHEDDLIGVNTKNKTATVIKTNDNFDMVSIDGAKSVRVDQKGKTLADLRKNGYWVSNAPEGVGDGSFWGALLWLGGEKLGSWLFGGVAGWFAKSAAETVSAEGAVWAQTTFSGTFSAGGKFAGQTVEAVTDALRSGSISAADVPIDVIARNGQTFILNTRSSAALMQAGVPRSAWNVVNRTGQAEFEGRLTNQLLNNGIPNGTNTIKSGSTILTH